MSTKKRGLGCLFYIVSILFVIFTSVFGFSLNSTKQFSQLLAGSYFEKNQFFTHTEIIDCQAEYDELLNISRSLYGQKRKINSYVLTRDFYSFNISGYNYSFKICAVPNYSDRQEMECLSIPLYLDNSSIGTGPVHDAK